MAASLSKLEQIVFEYDFIGPDAFREVVAANSGLKEVCLRVYHKRQTPENPDRMNARRMAGWICTFAAVPNMRAIAREQQRPELDDLPYVDPREVQELCPGVRMKWKLQV